MKMVNSDRSWGLVSQFFHWVMAGLIIWTFYIGWTMTGLEISPEMFATYNFHKSLGLTILTLAVLRLGWRLANRTPLLPEGMSGVERALAHLTHWGLYAILLAMPLSGWLLTSTAGVPVNYFGLGTVPMLTGSDEAWAKTLAGVHEIFSKLLLVLFVLHVLGALKHHFVSKDNTLRRMILPAR